MVKIGKETRAKYLVRGKMKGGMEMTLYALIKLVLS